MFRTYSLGRFAVIAAMVTLSGIANAGTIAFSGSRSNVDAPGPQSARCDTRTTANIRPGPSSTSVGTSNLGAFTPVLSHCIQLPLAQTTPFDLGEFTFDFGAGDTLFGTYSGTVTANLPGLFKIDQVHVITGGTGKFLDASGGFTSSGTLSFLNGPPMVQQNFRGEINSAGVPEPSSWALMIGGFGLLGVAVRRSRTPFARAQPLKSGARR